MLHVYKSHLQLPGFSLGQLASRLTSPRCRCSSAKKDKQIFLEENFFHHGDVGKEGAGAVAGGGDDGVGAHPQLVRRRRWGEQWGKSDEVPAGL